VYLQALSEGSRADWEAVLKAIRLSLEHNPTSSEPVLQLVEYETKFSQDGDNAARRAAADRDLDEFVNRNPELPDAYLARWRQKQVERSTSPEQAADIPRDDLEKALALADKATPPIRCEILLHAAQLAWEDKDPAKAEGYCRQAMETVPGDFRPHLLLGQAASNQEDTEANCRAAAIYVDGLKAIGRDEIALMVPLANIRASEGRFEEMDDLLRRIETQMKESTDETRSNYELNVAYLSAISKESQGDLIGAVSILRRQLRRDDGGEVETQQKELTAASWFALGRRWAGCAPRSSNTIRRQRPSKRPNATIVPVPI
jgi:hypothetical protein